eukprot:SAG31_NODE_12714_length_922_cov_0.800729_2_plen_131_part_00
MPVARSGAMQQSKHMQNKRRGGSGSGVDVSTAAKRKRVAESPRAAAADAGAGKKRVWKPLNAQKRSAKDATLSKKANAIIAAASHRMLTWQEAETLLRYPVSARALLDELASLCRIPSRAKFIAYEFCVH